MIVTIQVDDAAKSLAAMRKKGVPVTYDLHDAPWGQRRFMTIDPSGILVDVVEQSVHAEAIGNSSCRRRRRRPNPAVPEYGRSARRVRPSL
jgi:hypothetical protein